MNWEKLINQKITNVYYFEADGEIGFEDDEGKLHIIEEGTIILEINQKEYFEIITINQDNLSGIFLEELRLKDKEKFSKNSVRNDRHWKHIKNQIVRHIKFYEVEQQIEYVTEITEYKTIQTIELEFEFGNRIFISNAGYIEIDSKQAMTDGLMIYTDRKLGKKYNLFNDG